jgi:uncharacterized protein YfdQ (DUF2303 family)
MTIKTPPEAYQPVNPGETLETVLAAARLANQMVVGEDGKLHVFVPERWRMTEVPDASFLPPWTTQRVTVDNRASLVNYANRFSDPRSILIADYDALTISARLDWHPNNSDTEAHGKAAPDDHSVTLKLRQSEEFVRWDAMEGEFHEQETFARFLEENSTDVGFPEAATMIEISRDFEATVGQSYKSSVRLDNGDRCLRFESETKALNDVIVPQKFTLDIPIYNGEEPDILTANFRWKASGGGAIRLGFQWHRVEYQRRAHFAAIAHAAADETGLPVFMGRCG